MIKKVLITGVAGFLGSHLADALIKKNLKVVGIDNLRGGYKDNIPKKVEFHKIDNKPKLSISKSKEIIDKLQNRFFNGGYMSPSAIKDYMDCPLRFYYRYVANIKICICSYSISNCIDWKN